MSQELDRSQHAVPTASLKRNFCGIAAFFLWEMKMRINLCSQIAASLLTIASAVASAQGTTPNAQSPDSNQKAPGMGMHHNSGKHPGDRHCCGPKKTSGWSMMDKKERSEHREKMRSMKSYDECKAYVDDHHAKMMDRAKEKGRTLPSTSSQDACAWLKK
jgi:hypothetical protein